MAQEDRPIILYVEDDESLRMLTEYVLESQFRVIAASSGAAALGLATGLAPALLLLDVVMPGLDGIETLTALRALPHLAHLPAVFMTGRVEAVGADVFARLAPVSALAKPYEPNDLVDALHAALGEAGR